MNRKKTLIISSRQDDHVDFVVSSMNSMGLGDLVVRLNTEDFIDNCDVLFDGMGFEILFRDSGRRLVNNEIKSVWYRRPMDFLIDEPDTNVTEFIYAETNAFLEGVYFCCHDSALWINPLPALYRAEAKMQQIQLAKQVGLRTPHTVISNRPDKILDLFNSSDEVCYKLLGKPNKRRKTHSLLTQIITRDQVITNRHSIERCPAFFQEYITKRYDIRVIVSGSDIFAVEIHSQTNPLSQFDFRGVAPEQLKHQIHDLPEDIVRLIKEYMQLQGIIFASMDFLLSEGGDYIFLESNPNGQWLWLELLAEVKISRSLIKLMLDENC